MTSENMCAYAGRKRLGKNSVIKFNVNPTYEVPVCLLTSNISQFQSALDFAARLIDLQKSLSEDILKDTIYADYTRTIEEKHNQALIQVEKSASEGFSSKLSGIIQTIADKQLAFNEQVETIRSDYENQLRILVKEKKRLEDDATAAKTELESSLQKEIRNLRKQVTEKDAELQSLSKTDSIVREQCNLESQKLIRIIEEKNSNALDALNKSYEQTMKLKEEALQQREARVLQKEYELQTTLQRNASSTFRGQDGESYFQLLAESKMDWKLTDTSQIPHSCDYSATIHKVPVFFEMKNYTNDVRNEEVTKFLRDMKEHPEVHVGIFISLNTRIAGKDKDTPISIDWINDSQCAIYLQTFKELDVGHTLSLLDQIIKLSGMYNKLISSSSNISEESMLQGRIDKARVYIEEYITETCSLVKRVVNDQKLHRQLVESSYSHTLAVLKTQSAAINTALEILTGEYKENNTIDESLVEQVDEVKPKRGGKKKI